MNFKDFESSAISSLTINEEELVIVFKSSDKEYNYTINDTNWVENLTNTINNKESVGKFVSTSLKHKNILENKDNSK
tara:strand:- start:258 stop:488 length:231 start_codon:yes stop_codon:yes gene_type:complete